jgi:hypothetical protein
VSQIRASVVLLSPALLLLSGCAMAPSTPEPYTGSAISGTLHGGQQPLVGARLYLLAAGTGGYGTASTSLLTTSVAGTDSIGGYVLSGAGGGFSLGPHYTCTPGQQVYLYAVGGDPTGTNSNTASSLMAPLGACPSSNTLATAHPVITFSEVTTIVAAYALAGFATDPTHIASSGSPQALTGVANAFATAANLADATSGIAYATTAVGGGAVPQAEINTLANILAACVNSAGATSNACSTLFAAAPLTGTTGTRPNDTATAAINIAHYPAAQTAARWSLTVGIASQFQPTLKTQPNDFSVGIIYPTDTGSAGFDSNGNLWTVYGGGGIAEYSNTGQLLSPPTGFTGGGISASNSAAGLAIDPSNNVWALSASTANNAYTVNNYLSEFSNSGNPKSPSGGYTGGGLDMPASIAVDGSGNVWVGNGENGKIAGFTNTGTAVTGSPFAAVGDNINGLAPDNNGNIWFTATTPQTNMANLSSLAELSPSGSILRTIENNGSLDYYNLSVDASNDLFGSIYASNGNQLFELNANGAAINGSPFPGNTALKACLQTIVDGAGNMWCASDDDSIAEMSSTGVALSPDAGYIVGNAEGPVYIAIDNSGNVWTTGGYTYDSVNNNVNAATVELVGAAAPVITPLSLAASMGKLGTRP